MYRHFKGKLYYVIDIAEHTETGEKLVVYKALYADYKTYVRAFLLSQYCRSEVVTASHSSRELTNTRHFFPRVCEKM